MFEGSKIDSYGAKKSEGDQNRMRVIKRDGRYQSVSLDKVQSRIQNLSDDLATIDPILIAQKVCAQIYDGVRTSELDELAANLCTSMITEHPDYGVLGSRIIISNLHKNTSPSFTETVKLLYEDGQVCRQLYEMTQQHGKKINDVIKYQRDFTYDYFAYKTLDRGYLLKINGIIVERIQHMVMRVSLGLHLGDLDAALRSYELMSQKYFTHATPTLYHAGTNKPQLLSCYLLGMEDSIRGIYKTISDCAQISKWAGGIGIHAHNVRGKGSRIRGTNGHSDGIIPMLRVMNDTARYVNQSGRRKGAFAIYLSPHHPDILDFLDIRKNHGKEEERCRDLFTAMWISDLFMERVKNNQEWSLFDPDMCPGLSDAYGDDFKQLYCKYEQEGRAKKVIKAQEVWRKIIESQIESGTPYMLYKDAINRKTNQKNVGTIRSSNLCVVPETLVLTDSGYQRIDELAGIGKANIWNGSEFSESVVSKTGENQEIIKVITSDQCELECTPYHRFHIQNKGGIIEQIEARNLKPDMKLIQTDYPVIKKGNAELKYLCEFHRDDTEVPLDSHIMIRKRWLDRVLGKKNKIVGTDLNFLRKIKLMLNTMGRNGTIKSVGTEWELSVDTQELVAIKNVIDEGRLSDTYCFNEPKRHTGIFNGMIAGNCAEIAEYSDENEYACCTLASIGLPRFVENGVFNFDLLVEVLDTVVDNLNNIIDLNYYPVPETELSNKRHRPLGIGVQGLADVYIMMGYAFDSDEALQLNKEIFEAICYGSLRGSVRLSKRDGPYSTFEGSPLSKGLFQFDLWDEDFQHPSDRWDWEGLRQQIMEHGVRNSLLVAQMPTASTSQILGNNESTEAYTSNIYARRTGAGDFALVNKHLARELLDLGLWTPSLKNMIIANGGSIQNIDGISDDIKARYKTVWELKQRFIVQQAVDRGPYICQTQSMNLFFEEITQKTLTKAHFYGWERGLKTGSYYIRTRAKVRPQQFTIEPSKVGDDVELEADAEAKLICSLTNRAACEMCSA